MNVMPRTAKSPKGATKKTPAQPFTFPAPIRGWVLNENRVQAQPGGARVLDNWVCTTTGIRVRGGCRKYATIGGAVTSMFCYRFGGVETFFAATASAIYNITAPATPTTVPATSVSGLGSGSWSNTMFGTAGGNFLVIANGTDSVRNYDGATWTTPAITVATSSTLSHVWSFANRLFFIQKNTLTAWYLPVDSIAGAAASFSLQGVFTRGGSLLFGAKWSLDAGDGLDDKCVFVSTEGEVAVYEGTNPGSAATWAKVGVYQMPKPLGKNCSIQAGGDLLIATEVGLIPISAAVKQDIAALEGSAVSRPISPYWQQQGRNLAGSAWEMIKIPRANMMIVSQPSAGTFTCLAVNLQTGAWSRFTGWDTSCLGYFANAGYFGSADSCVYTMESSGADNGVPYTCLYLGQHEAMGAYGAQKTVTQMRPVFAASGPISPQITVTVDYSETVQSPPGSPDDYTVGSWDSAIWDSDVWDGIGGSVSDIRWTAIGRTGHVIAPELQLTFGVTPTPEAELIAIDAQFKIGATVT